MEVEGINFGPMDKGLGFTIDVTGKKFEDNWKELRQYFIDYKREKTTEFSINPYTGDVSNVYGRYCVALSIDDILKKMDEIEGKM